MKKYLVLALLAAAPLVAASNIGVVSLETVLNDSKVGQTEQKSFEALQKQFSDTIESLDKELAEIDEKARDEDYMDSLSPDAEKQMQTRFQQLIQTRGQQEQQAMQILQQERMRLIQTLTTEVQRASALVAKDKKLELIVRDDMTFFFKPEMDLSKEVVKEMDKLYEQEHKE